MRKNLFLKKHIGTRKVTALTCMFVSLIMARRIEAQASVLEDLDITSARPLHDALLHIQNRLFVPIDFEQGPPKTIAELVTNKERPELRPNRFYLRKQRLVVHFVVGEKDAFEAVQTALAAYSASRLPGSFVAVRQGEAIVVKPAVDALSDLEMTIPDGHRSPDETAATIAEKLGKISGKKVRFLSQPYRNGDLIRFSANSEPVYVSLAKWSGIEGPTSFRLLYDPLSQAYCLSFGPVPRRPIVTSETLNGLTTRRPVSSPYFTKDRP